MIPRNSLLKSGLREKIGPETDLENQGLQCRLGQGRMGVECRLSLPRAEGTERLGTQSR